MVITLILNKNRLSYSRSLPREMQDDFLEVSVHRGFRL